MLSKNRQLQSDITPLQCVRQQTRPIPIDLTYVHRLTTLHKLLSMHVKSQSHCIQYLPYIAYLFVSPDQKSIRSQLR